MQHINILIRQIKTLGYETAKCFILESVPTTDALEIRIQGRLKTECPLKLNPSTVHTQYLGGKFKKAAMERAAFVRFGGNGVSHIIFNAMIILGNIEKNIKLPLSEPCKILSA